ncbi:crossover junction endodeoxyribonuclease RusA superfamily protein [Rhodococcus sp. 2G]|nr:crossover junction endodeoxyribonuclease RusA superfamily protein [Rhodococcus sp. 2G]APE12403.1 crossover junction endodeoxyribonuclease RusA superfamily protein [Rhodococcus sp. 2G]
MNKRMHWAPQSRIIREIRTKAWLLAMQAKVPTGCEHVTVCLHYRPKINRRQDEDNLVPILKAACDGLVDADVVPDDTPKYMQKLMPVIHPAEKGRAGTIWLTIAPIGDSQ